MESINSADDISTVYLHGDLDLKILEARRLPNMDLATESLRRCFTGFDLCRKPLIALRRRNGRRLRRRRRIITSDPYVSVCLAGATVARTRVIFNSENPVWNNHFKIALAHPVSKIEFQVKDNDVFGAGHIGVASVPAEMINSGEVIEDWFPIVGSRGKPPKTDCALRLKMKFDPFNQNPNYRTGIPENYGLIESYFPARQGGAVTLYQDAHSPDGILPEIELEEGKAAFRHENCWEDICEAILEAHHLVYIVGWSIYHKVKLVREPEKPLPAAGRDLNLGELLKYKSQEGVRVLLLVWNDKTSHDKFFINTAGLMQTHDKETRKFFKHSAVTCLLSPRYASSKLSLIKKQVVGSLYTHHQKCVIVDTQDKGNKRKITSFIGGLDLCDGRYDTPEHRLFHDLDTVFMDDFHNPTFPAGTKGPRQPWHDLHCKIEGPAAYDVLTNFEQRWRKARKWSAPGRHFKRRVLWHDDALLKIERISWIASPSPTVPNNDPSLWVTKGDDHGRWHVQIFRSIDSGSLKGFPKDVHSVESQHLVCEKNVVIDRSIQTAYVQAIRRAQHFIYIENQYFIGSSYAWPSYKNSGADNLIPIELALKLASKIRNGERFAIYIVIPMWPEGAPTSASVQEVLYWQGQTMQMMYEIVARELKSAQLEHSHPCDYLNFYCLGNREEQQHEEETKFSSEPPSNDNKVSASQKHRRFMIYVHAKGMIVDDEYIILGSANINERSMDGSRDTEIAMGAYQPHHIWANTKKYPLGLVHGYRMSLWAEHLGKTGEDSSSSFKDPKSLDCVRDVNHIAQNNWERYAAEDTVPLQGHLLKYPVQIDADGKVSPLPGHECFPDVGGKVLGTKSALPDALTT
ncbi:unnamed protein product [Cuscuta campestris]|uniref:Phospholipase D n=1 Tax=Cuscuta campestris TaxID=132261 RepID=A0A484MZC2_9ASTE|nr:unnamed protein product [Cuscuta campestris]